MLPAAPLHLHATPAKGRQVAAKVLDSFHTCPIPGLPGWAAPSAPGGARCWPISIPPGVSNGGTEAINQIIEKVRGLTHGFKKGRSSCFRLSLVPAPGHTRGMQVVVIETGGRPVVVGGDVAGSFGELDEPHTEGQLRVRALDPELVRLAHEHEPWRPRAV